MSTQPKALRLADWLESVWMQYAAEDDGQMMQSAAELRRLHEVNAELVYLLKRYVSETPLGHQPHLIVDLAMEAIAKATGEQE